MAVEIERKFLVRSDAWRAGAGAGERVCQGYLIAGQERTVRVRLAGDQAFITVKGPRTGISRTEFEYEIPVQDAEQMLRELCAKPLLEKTRYRVSHFNAVWEVDEYGGDRQGLVTAEIELKRDDEPIIVPAWIGEEVSQDRRYRSSVLADEDPKAEPGSRRRGAVPGPRDPARSLAAGCSF